MSNPRNVAALATVKQALRASSQAAAASFSLLGLSFDRSAGDFQSFLAGVFLGAATGTPTTLSVTAKLQHSADNSNWDDVVADDVNPTVQVALTAVNTQGFFAIDASRLRRYVRLVFTVAFTGGSTPNILMDAKFMAGGSVSIPPTHA